MTALSVCGKQPTECSSKVQYEGMLPHLCVWEGSRGGILWGGTVGGGDQMVAHLSVWGGTERLFLEDEEANRYVAAHVNVLQVKFEHLILRLVLWLTPTTVIFEHQGSKSNTGSSRGSSCG